MKVGILTFQATSNYGACLQCTALTQMVNLLGAECETINYRCENIVKREIKIPLFSLGLKKFPVQLLISIYRWLKSRIIKKFIEKNCALSEVIYDRSNIVSANNEYDAFISGSDIIWELYVTGADYTYFLDFVKEKNKKYSFSSSFGYRFVPEEFLPKVKKYLSEYRQISVRENEGADIIKGLLSKDVKVTVDPTLLFDGGYWTKMEEPYKLEKQKYILLYFDDVEHNSMKFAQKLAKKENVPVIYLRDFPGFRKYENVKNIVNVSVGQFLWLIHNALYVITGSYHGVLFSINFNTPFYYFNRAHQGRINTVVDNLGITDRNIANLNDCNSEIEWNKVNEKLSNLRNDSIQYIKNVILKEYV